MGAPVQDLDRKVFCLLGIPVDVVGMEDLVDAIVNARDPKAALISTPNLNFLVSSQTDPHFRDVLRMSDLCPADGASLVWLARLLRIPISERVAGSDMFEALAAQESGEPVKVFLFGGDNGVAAAAAARINAEARGVTCVGWIDPGQGTAEELSRPEYLDAINASGADFLVVALGAAKGQKWLSINHDQIVTRIRSHLGAVINFQAGRIRRAPIPIREAGLEWLWRVKEEPQLWSRYLRDGLALVALLAFRVMPIRVLETVLRRGRHGVRLVHRAESAEECTLELSGDARIGGVDELVTCLRNDLPDRKTLVFDIARLRFVDSRLIGLLFLVQKAMRGRGGRLKITGATPAVRLGLRLHGAGDLVE